MAQETVTVGDTEVQITETDDGFEVTEVEDDFLQHVKDSGISRSNDVEIQERAVIPGDVVVSYESHLSKSEMQTLIDDDRIKVGRVAADGDRVEVNLIEVSE